MDSWQTLQAVLGWSSLINLGFLTFATIVLVVAGSSIKTLHARLFGLAEADLDRAYFQYLANYKILIFVLNVAPYLALRLAG